MGEHVTISYDAMVMARCTPVQAAFWIGRKLWACYGRWLDA